MKEINKNWLTNILIFVVVILMFNSSHIIYLLTKSQQLLHLI